MTSSKTIPCTSSSSASRERDPCAAHVSLFPSSQGSDVLVPEKLAIGRSFQEHRHEAVSDLSPPNPGALAQPPGVHRKVPGGAPGVFVFLNMPVSFLPQGGTGRRGLASGSTCWSQAQAEAAPGKHHVCSRLQEGPSTYARLPRRTVRFESAPIPAALPACPPCRCALQAPTETPGLFVFPAAGGCLGSSPLWGQGGAGPPDPVLTGAPGQPLRTRRRERGMERGLVGPSRCSPHMSTVELAGC